MNFHENGEEKHSVALSSSEAEIYKLNTCGDCLLPFMRPKLIWLLAISTWITQTYSDSNPQYF